MNPIILIVDDEPAGRAALESVLLTQDYTLVFASNGFEALRKAQEVLPDVILLDVMMPDLNGYEVCRHLRSDPLVAEVPIVLVTALDDRDSRLRGLEAGADDFVNKPIDRGELRARVRAIVRLNRYRRLQDERAKLERQLEETTRRTEELEFLATISVDMRAIHQRPDLMDLLVSRVVQKLNAQAGAMALLEGGVLLFYTAQGSMRSYLGKSLPHDDSIFWRSIDCGEAIILDSKTGCRAGQDTLEILLSPEIGCCMVSLLKSDADITGVLFVGLSKDQRLTDDQKRLVVTVSEIAGYALQRMHASEELQGLVQSRTRELESIYKVASAASESLDISRTYQKALELAVEAVDTPIGALFLLNEDNKCLSLIAQVGLPSQVLSTLTCVDLENSLEGQVLLQNQIFSLPDLSAAPQYYEALLTGEALSYTGFPLRVRETVVGVLAMIRPGDDPFMTGNLTLVSFIADHLGLVIENRRLYQQAEKNAVLEERARLARELHDSVTQLLYSAALFSTGTKKFIHQGKLETAMQYLDQIEQVTQQALREMRLMIFELRAPTAMNLGLAGEIRNRLDSVERRSGISAVLHADEIPPLSAHVEDTLYRVALEALNNSLKHAFARNVDVFLSAVDGLVTMAIKDDGVGFHLAEGKRSGGLGLTSMQERIEQIGGTLQIDSQPGSGTMITITIRIGKNDGG